MRGGPIDRAELVEAVGEGAACRHDEDGCLGLIGEPEEVDGDEAGIDTQFITFDVAGTRKPEGGWPAGTFAMTFRLP